MSDPERVWREQHTLIMGLHKLRSELRYANYVNYKLLHIHTKIELYREILLTLPAHTYFLVLALF